MNARPVVATVVAIVLVTTLVSGPLVSLVDLTAERTFAEGNLGEGRVAIDDVSLPDRATLERGDFGSGSYYLHVDPATLSADSIGGRPIVSYELSLPAFGFTTSTVKVLRPGDDGEIELTLEEKAFGPSQITEDSYEGQLRVDVRRDGSEEVLAQKNVTVEVVG